MEIKKILLVTKFKGTSERALQRALSFAKEQKAHLDILNVIDLPDQSIDSVDEKVEALDHSLSELISHEKTMRKIIEKTGKHKWTPEAHITMENPNNTKERLLSLGNKDFLVIGLGDWSDQLDLSPYVESDANLKPPACPLWLVPHQARKNLRKQMIIVGDKLPNADQYDNVGKACELALKKEMSLDVMTTSLSVQKKWSDWLDKLGIQGYSLANFKNMSELTAEVEKRNPGLLLITIQSGLTGQTIQKMESIGRADIIVV